MLEPRKSAPQGRHPQGLCARGRKVLEQLFPGLNEKNGRARRYYSDVIDDVLWFNHCVYLLNAPSSQQDCSLLSTGES